MERERPPHCVSPNPFTANFSENSPPRGSRVLVEYSSLPKIAFVRAYLRLCNNLGPKFGDWVVASTGERGGGGREGGGRGGGGGRAVNSTCATAADDAQLDSQLLLTDILLHGEKHTTTEILLKRQQASNQLHNEQMIHKAG